MSFAKDYDAIDKYSHCQSGIPERAIMKQVSCSVAAMRELSQSILLIPTKCAGARLLTTLEAARLAENGCTVEKFPSCF